MSEIKVNDIIDARLMASMLRIELQSINESDLSTTEKQSLIDDRVNIYCDSIENEIKKKVAHLNKLIKIYEKPALSVIRK